VILGDQHRSSPEMRHGVHALVPAQKEGDLE
jgi:hypothetical protein